LNHRLHDSLRFSRKSVLLQCLFQTRLRSRFAKGFGVADSKAATDRPVSET
jgi:hypothetical protein